MRIINKGQIAVLDSQLIANIKAMPKIELHRHLEGAVRLETLIDIAREHAFEMPDYNVETLRPFVQMMPEEQRDMTHFLAKFATLRQFYRSPEVITRISKEAVYDAADDQIKYMELRFTPNALSNITRASPDEVIGWVCDAVNEAAQERGIVVRLIVSVNRHESLESAYEVVNASVNYVDSGVVGVDLAGREEGYPAGPFRPIFREAREAGLGITIHAGEWEGAQSVWDAIGNIGASRVGHGIRALEDPGILTILMEREITLEVCPTSNVDSGVVSSLAHHPLPWLTQDGVATTINTDDPLISGITLSDELIRAVQHMEFTLADLKAATLRAAEASFLPPVEKGKLLQNFHTWLNNGLYRS
ncbi:MAG: adenosine deaminase [Anaerolineae bacterium]|jgi:adenosine deaminase|nr:adenosine deaminase [Anaerolineae bacterium]